MLGVHEVEIGDMVDEPAVGFFRHVLVEASVPTFHVINRYVHALGDHSSDGTVGVTQDENRIWMFVTQNSLRLAQSVSENRTQAGCIDLKQVIGGTEAHLVEED